MAAELRTLDMVRRCGRLHVECTECGRRFFLPDGSIVPGEAVVSLIARGFLTSIDDGLLDGCTQTLVASAP